MNCTRVLACAMLMSSGAAQAQDQFLEVINTYALVEGTYGNATPHAGPVRVNFTGGGFNPATGFVEFANAPAPYVYVSVTGSGIQSTLDATLKYSFDVSGPASSYVPLTFTANFNLGHGTLGTRTSVDFRVNGRGVDFATGGSQYVQGSVLCQWTGVGRCDGSTTPSGLSAVTVNVAGSPAYFGGSAYGTITGTFMAPTDAAGRGIGVVQMNAIASAGGNGLESWAFIDPKFEIDPTYLALNPTAVFALLPGMGNELAMMPVPEPGSALLLTGGMLGLLLSARRRKSRSQSV